MYRIKDWDEHFEKSESRKCSGALRWVAIPTKHDGAGYRRLVRRGVDLFAGWIAILQVAAKCPTRGVLADENGPLTAEDIAIKADFPTEVIERALEATTDPVIGWIQLVEQGHAPENSPDSSGAPPENGEKSSPQYSTVQDRTEHGAALAASGGENAPDPPSEYAFLLQDGKTEWPLSLAKLEQYRESYPDLDVDLEMRKARQWCRDPPRGKRRKTARGMAAFLTSWLNRAVDRGGGPVSASRSANGADKCGLSVTEAMTKARDFAKRWFPSSTMTRDEIKSLHGSLEAACDERYPGLRDVVDAIGVKEIADGEPGWKQQFERLWRERDAG